MVHEAARHVEMGQVREQGPELGEEAGQVGIEVADIKLVGPTRTASNGSASVRTLVLQSHLRNRYCLGMTA